MSFINKFCINCKHFRNNKENLGTPLCVQLPKGEPNLIWGYQAYHSCDVGRQPGGSCGPEGKLYVALM